MNAIDDFFILLIVLKYDQYINMPFYSVAEYNILYILINSDIFNNSFI